MEGGEERKQCLAERSRGKRSFTKAQASQPWIHALSLLSPFVRLLRRLTTAARPCGTRAALRQRMLKPMPEQRHVTHSAVNTILLQSVSAIPHTGERFSGKITAEARVCFVIHIGMPHGQVRKYGPPVRWHCAENELRLLSAGKGFAQGFALHEHFSPIAYVTMFCYWSGMEPL